MILSLIESVNIRDQLIEGLEEGISRRDSIIELQAGIITQLQRTEKTTEVGTPEVTVSEVFEPIKEYVLWGLPLSIFIMVFGAFILYYLNRDVKARRDD